MALRLIPVGWQLTDMVLHFLQRQKSALFFFLYQILNLCPMSCREKLPSPGLNALLCTLEATEESCFCAVQHSSQCGLERCCQINAPPASCRRWFMGEYILGLSTSSPKTNYFPIEQNLGLEKRLKGGKERRHISLPLPGSFCFHPRLLLFLLVISQIILKRNLKKVGMYYGTENSSDVRFLEFPAKTQGFSCSLKRHHWAFFDTFI